MTPFWVNRIIDPYEACDLGSLRYVKGLEVRIISTTLRYVYLTNTIGHPCCSKMKCTCRNVWNVSNSHSGDDVNCIRNRYIFSDIHGLLIRALLSTGDIFVPMIHIR